MKYTLETESPMCSLEDFAEKHGLELVVTERILDGWHRERNTPRYIARFKNTEIKRGACLAGVYGEGDSPENAIKEYAQCIIGERLIINAMANDRREIVAPNEWKGL